MAAYEKRFPICKEIPIVLDTKQTENTTSPDGAVTIIVRWCKINAEAPGWLKRMAGVQHLIFYQKNTIDRRSRTLHIEAWNDTFAGKVNIIEKCRYIVHPEFPKKTAFYQSASLNLNLLPGFDGAAEWCFVNAYLANIKKGREIIDLFVRQIIDEEGIESIPPFSDTSPHTLGDGRDFVPTTEKIGINLVSVDNLTANLPSQLSIKKSSPPGTQNQNQNQNQKEHPPLPQITTTPAPSHAGTHEGYLSKWTNYLSGYQQRWFVLADGVLQYYKNKAQAEQKIQMQISSGSSSDQGSDPRGSMPIQDVVISVNSENDLEFSVYNKDVAFYLQTESRDERRKWIIALGSAKALLVDEAGPIVGRSRGIASFDTTSRSATAAGAPSSSHSRHSSTCSLSAMDVSTPATLDEKLSEIKTYEDLVTKQLMQMKNDLNEALLGRPGRTADDMEASIRDIKEREMIFTATSRALLDVLSGSIDTIKDQERSWERVLEKEYAKRVELERSISFLEAKRVEVERALASQSDGCAQL